MQARSFWKGYLKLSLVTCPVAMLPATTQGETVRFHTINKLTGNRVESRYIDAITNKPVAADDQALGYPRGDDDYVLLEEDELDAVALDSTRTIDIDTFVPAESIDSVWFDKPHFLLPNDKIGEQAFAVIREAMRESAVVGIARLVLYRRERAVLLQPRDKGIVLWTLRYGDELRDPAPYFSGIGAPHIEPELRSMVDKLIAKRRKPWSPALTQDPVRDRLLELIADRQKQKKPAKAATPKTGNVVNIMDALRKSLEGKPKR